MFWGLSWEIDVVPVPGSHQAHAVRSFSHSGKDNRLRREVVWASIIPTKRVDGQVAFQGT